MAKNKPQWMSRWKWLPGFVAGPPQLAEVENDVRTLMKTCGDLQKELDSQRLGQDERKEKLLLEFIPVADALEAFTRELVNAKSLPDHHVKELEMLGRRFARALERSGVARLLIQAGETPLDAACHEVVRAEARDGLADGTILEVIRPGYMLAGRVLRPAKVVVATREG
jgi:molecular chaperone GrpE (heat shock protein)